MIDLGVSKLALIAVVALVVVGPERERKIAYYMKRVHVLRAQQKVLDPTQLDVV